MPKVWAPAGELWVVIYNEHVKRSFHFSVLSLNLRLPKKVQILVITLIYI